MKLFRRSRRLPPVTFLDCEVEDDDVLMLFNEHGNALDWWSGEQLKNVAQEMERMRELLIEARSLLVPSTMYDPAKVRRTTVFLKEVEEVIKGNNERRNA